MKAGVIQLTSGEVLEENLERAGHYIDRAASEGCKLVCLPEVFSLFTTDEKKYGAAQDPQDNQALKFLQSKASEHKMWIHGGSINVKGDEEGKVFNRSSMINPQGEVVVEYDKIHLFDVNLNNGGVYKESLRTIPGVSTQICDTDFGKVGMSVCYDLRFPELYREMSQEGARVLMVPAAFTRKTGQDHWEVLLRARAIENQAFLLAANQSGLHQNGLKTWGHSMIIDPWGRILAEIADGEGLITAELDFKILEDFRSSMPCLEHRRIL